MASRFFQDSGLSASGEVEKCEFGNELVKKKTAQRIMQGISK